MKLPEYADLPPKQGLYDPANEHDSCGVGLVAAHLGFVRGVAVRSKPTSASKLTGRIRQRGASVTVQCYAQGARFGGNPIWYLTENLAPNPNLQQFSSAWWQFANGMTLTSLSEYLHFHRFAGVLHHFGKGLPAAHVIETQNLENEILRGDIRLLLSADNYLH